MFLWIDPQVLQMTNRTLAVLKTGE